MASDNKMINATGLWVQKDKQGNVLKDKNGNTWLAGNLGGVRVLIFKIKDKKSPTHPDFNMVFAPNEPAPSQREPGDDDAPF